MYRLVGEPARTMSMGAASTSTVSWQFLLGMVNRCRELSSPPFIGRPPDYSTGCLYSPKLHIVIGISLSKRER